MRSLVHRALLFAGIRLELSLHPLYAGRKLMPEMLEPNTGRLLQVDAIHFRPA